MSSVHTSDLSSFEESSKGSDLSSEEEEKEEKVEESKPEGMSKLPFLYTSMSQHVISIREIIVIALTIAKRTIYRSRPVYEVSSFNHGKRYRNDFSDADKCW